VISRRYFLKTLVGLAGVCSLNQTLSIKACAETDDSREKVLRLHNIHTGERLETCFCRGGKHEQSEIEKVWYLLRCHYKNEVKPIDIGVIDLLCSVKDKFGQDKEVTIISGYRSPEYNQYLSHLGRHVASGSLHLEGLAIDFALPGVRTQDLSKAALRFAAGGVGLYPDFVHIDVGRVRRW
jgi:uncharacterized protein YcbK (DUF882 family)